MWWKVDTARSGNWMIWSISCFGTSGMDLEPGRKSRKKLSSEVIVDGKYGTPKFKRPCGTVFEP
jgi:hypothetical protein